MSLKYNMYYKKPDYFIAELVYLFSIHRFAISTTPSSNVSRVSDDNSFKRKNLTQCFSY